ncbi:glycosyltransferase family 4 protein [Zhouia spongiae]|uniref:Glycosyltransferase family 4 protein n=1 Tax=Zhouia spongiae TaxID=2202721 RepID=A0ABY3YK29_9FLAO|nr:glycosyltransferase [Zhouia spongiae]UNY98204.1 glycosyltransferase family 4 protein [Zhouia spongiae]
MSTVLIIGYVWPEPDSSAAGRRMLQLIRLFQSQGMKVVFSSPAQRTGNGSDLEETGVETRQIELNNSSFDVFIEGLRPQIVMFDRYMMEEQFGWRVNEKCPEAIRILDTEDLHFLRKARHKAVKNNAEADLFEGDLVLRELASIYRSDLTLIISEAEMKLLKDVFKLPDELLMYLPFLEDPIRQSDIKAWKPFEERSHFIFIGNFLHAPNWDAVLYLKKHVWPLIRKQLPQVELHIYGAYATQKVFDLHQEQQGFLIKGKAENAREVMQAARVCIAPLRFGAGLKGKLIEAMQCGTPSVTTEVGAEGIKGDLEWNGFVTGDPVSMARMAAVLYTGKTQWYEAQASGISILNKRFDAAVFKKNLIYAIDRLQYDQDRHRRVNILGRMLNHQTMQSYRYMAKWIEEKNKN